MIEILLDVGPVAGPLRGGRSRRSEGGRVNSGPSGIIHLQSGILSSRPYEPALRIPAGRHSTMDESS